MDLFSYLILTAPITSKLQKKIKAFRSLRLRIDISSNFKTVNFLDVTFNLDITPFNKNNQIITYINVNSNNPRSIIKQIPKAVNLRIDRLSSCKKIFEYYKGTYNQALYNRGFQQKLENLDFSLSNTTERDNTMNKSNIFMNNNYGKMRSTPTIHILEIIIIEIKIEKERLYGLHDPFSKLSNINIGKYFFRFN